MTVWAVVVAAGTGERFGSAKQFASLGGRPIVSWSVTAAASVVDGVVLVVPQAGAPPIDDVAAVVPGAATRSGSVRAGLAAVPRGADVVVVHDAARPLAAPSLFRAVIDAVVAGADGAVPAVPVGDTVKRARDGHVVETLDRAGLVAVQTPQAFVAAVLRRAHAGDPDATDDAALVEAIGGRVVVVPGDVRNLKITTPQDLAVARAMLES